MLCRANKRGERLWSRSTAFPAVKFSKINTTGVRVSHSPIRPVDAFGLHELAVLSTILASTGDHHRVANFKDPWSSRGALFFFLVLRCPR